MNYNPDSGTPFSEAAHRDDDVNASELSHHHTIGEGPTEAISLAIAKRNFYPQAVSYTRVEVDAIVAAAVASVPISSPVGEIKMWGGTTAPAQHLLCNGASLLRADYPDLFDVIGTNYGSVDGTHFTLPDLRGRVPVGLDAGQTEFDVLAEVGGAKTATLAEANIPVTTNFKLVDSGAFESGATNAPLVSTTGTRHKYVASQTPTAFSTLPPYVVINYIIKAF